jgi:hypothetical protein
VIVAVIEREKVAEMPDEEAAHIALDGLREQGVSIGPRPPEDPHPGVGDELSNS